MNLDDDLVPTVVLEGHLNVRPYRGRNVEAEVYGGVIDYVAVKVKGRVEVRRLYLSATA